MTSPASGGLRRWSQRKLAARQRPAPPQESDLHQTALQQQEPDPRHGDPAIRVESSMPVADPVSPEAPEPSPAELACAHGLPDPTKLTENDLIGDFMRPDIPGRLRRLAMRRMWRINPILANLDGLVDYGEDFTDAATVIENFATLYKVGAGYRTPEDDKMPVDTPADEMPSEETVPNNITAEPGTDLDPDEGSPSHASETLESSSLPDGTAQPDSASSGHIDAGQDGEAICFAPAESFDNTDTHPQPVPVRSRMVFVRRS